MNDSDIIFFLVCVLHALICLASRNWFIQMCIKLSHLWTLWYYFKFLPLPLHFCCSSLCFIHGQNQQQSWSQHKCLASSFTCNWIVFFLLVSPFYAWPAFYERTPEIWICIQLWQVPVKSTMTFKIFSSFYLLQPSHVGKKSWMLWWIKNCCAFDCKRLLPIGPHMWILWTYLHFYHSTLEKKYLTSVLDSTWTYKTALNFKIYLPYPVQNKLETDKKQQHLVMVTNVIL